MTNKSNKIIDDLLQLREELPIDINWEILGDGDIGILKDVEIDEESNEICFIINLPNKKMSEAIFKTGQNTIEFVKSTKTITGRVWTIQLKGKYIKMDKKLN